MIINGGAPVGGMGGTVSIQNLGHDEVRILATGIRDDHDRLK